MTTDSAPTEDYGRHQHAVFGPWTVPGPALTLDEITVLPEGTEIEIVWDGGNGPHRYLLVKDERGAPYVIAPDENPQGRMRYYNRLDGFIGPSPLTEVRRVHSPEGRGGRSPVTSQPAGTPDTADHYAVQVTNMPPTEIICKCGQRFVGGDVIAKQKDHMDKENS